MISKILEPVFKINNQLFQPRSFSHYIIEFQLVYFPSINHSDPHREMLNKHIVKSTESTCMQWL